MSKANRVATRVTLAGPTLNGYSGRVDIVTRHRRRWWHKLLRRYPISQERVYADCRNSSARVWRQP